MGFIIIFLLLVLAAHGYVFWHVWCMLPLSPVLKTVVLSLMALHISFSLSESRSGQDADGIGSHNL